MQAVRPLTHLPVLRKDFIVSPYQLYQAKLAGADVVLLIAAALTVDECKALGKLAHQLEMVPTILEKFNLLHEGKLNNASAVLFGRDFYYYPQCLPRLACFKGTTILV